MAIYSFKLVRTIDEYCEIEVYADSWEEAEEVALYESDSGNWEPEPTADNPNVEIISGEKLED